MATPADLDFIVARTKKFKLNPFDQELFSLNHAGNYRLFIHYLESAGCLIIYSPLILLKETEQTPSVLKILLQGNLPSSDPLIKWSIDGRGRVWQSLFLSFNEAQTADFDALIERFLQKADAMLSNLAASGRADTQETGSEALDSSTQLNSILWG